MEAKKKLSYLDKLNLIYDNKVTEDWLLHYGSYFNKHTVPSAAKFYFESMMAMEPKAKKRAQQLGLI